MKLRSRGLGRKELVMDFREYDISWDAGEVLVSGTIREPVTWDFSIRIDPDDIPGMIRVGINRHTVRLVWEWMLHRTKEQNPPPVERPSPGVARRVRAPVRASAPPGPAPTATAPEAADELVESTDPGPAPQPAPVPVPAPPDVLMERGRGRVPSFQEVTELHDAAERRERRASRRQRFQLASDGRAASADAPSTGTEGRG